MKQIVSFEMDDGSFVFIEVEDTDEGGGIRRVARMPDGIVKAEKGFMEGLKLIKPAAESVLNSFREMNTPDEIALEFGVKFSAKVGAVLTSVDGEATFKVALKWRDKGDSRSHI